MRISCYDSTEKTETQGRQDARAQGGDESVRMCSEI
jgi:hypothetical protein